MELRFQGKTYVLPEICPSTNRQKAKLRKDLSEHGPEAFLTSRKLSPFAGCVTDELVAAGAEVVADAAPDPGPETEVPVVDSDTPAPEAAEEN